MSEQAQLKGQTLIGQKRLKDELLQALKVIKEMLGALLRQFLQDTQCKVETGPLSTFDDSNVEVVPMSQTPSSIQFVPSEAPTAPPTASPPPAAPTLANNRRKGPRGTYRPRKRKQRSIKGTSGRGSHSRGTRTRDTRTRSTTPRSHTTQTTAPSSTQRSQTTTQRSNPTSTPRSQTTTPSTCPGITPANTNADELWMPCQTLQIYENSRHVKWKGVPLGDYISTRKVKIDGKSVTKRYEKLSSFMGSYLATLEALVEKYLPQNDMMDVASGLDQRSWPYDIERIKSMPTIRNAFRMWPKVLKIKDISESTMDQELENLVRVLKDPRGPILWCFFMESNPTNFWLEVLKKGNVSDTMRKLIEGILCLPYGSADAERAFR